MNLRYVAAVLVLALTSAARAEDRQLEAAKATYKQEIDKARVAAENAQTKLIAKYEEAINRADGLVKLGRPPKPTADELRKELAFFSDQLISLPSLVAKSAAMIPLRVPVLLKLKSSPDRYLGVQDTKVVVIDSNDPTTNKVLQFQAIPLDGTNGEQVQLESVQRPGWVVTMADVQSYGRDLGITDKPYPRNATFVPEKPLSGNKGISIRWVYLQMWITHDGKGQGIAVRNPTDAREASFEIIPVAP